MAPKRRTAALLVSAFLEPDGNPPWYARISHFEDPFRPAVQGPTQTTVDGVCAAVRTWLEAVIADPGVDTDGSIKRNSHREES